MTDTELVVIGTRPPSAASATHSLRVYATGRPGTSQQSRGNSYDEQLCDGGRRRTVTLGKANQGKTNTMNRHHQSYVDETLFGSRPQSPGFPAPWDDSPTQNTSNQVWDCTDYRSRDNDRTGQINGASRPRTSHSSRGQTQKGKTESCLSLWALSRRDDNGTRTQTELNRPCSSRNSKNDLNKKAVDKKLFKSSFVDESLFGPRLDEASFDAPWNKAERRTPALSYDGRQHRVTIKYDMPAQQQHLRKQFMRSTPSSGGTVGWKYAFHKP